MAHHPSKAANRIRACAWRIALGGALGLLAAPAWAAPDPAQQAGIWTLAVDNTHRACKINLRTDETGTGYALAMPPGCRRAVPALKDVQSWSLPSDGSVELNGASGETIVVFNSDGSGALHSTDPQGEALSLTLYRHAAAAAPAEGSIVTLTATGTTAPESLGASGVASQPARVSTAAAKPASVVKPVPAEPREVAGHYAVLRGDRDTGCMVTLDPARSANTTSKARLAPACRDQGIIIFDPLGWQVEAGHLVLTARKGHTIRLDRSAEGIWVKVPTDAKALGLKPL